MEVQTQTARCPAINPQQPQLKAVKFPEANGKYVGPPDSGITDLPTLTCTVDDLPAVLSCWHMSFWNRLKYLFTGKLWFCVLGTMHPPVALFTGNPFDRRGS